MSEREQSMKFDRKPSVGCGHENTFSRDPPSLVQELPLPLTTTNVLQHRTRMNNIEATVLERQVTPVASDKGKTRITHLEKPSIVQANRSNSLFVRIPGFEVVRVIVAAVTSYPNIQ